MCEWLWRWKNKARVAVGMDALGRVIYSSDSRGCGRGLLLGYYGRSRCRETIETARVDLSVDWGASRQRVV